jgi:hypothetical protein
MEGKSVAKDVPPTQRPSTDVCPLLNPNQFIPLKGGLKFDPLILTGGGGDAVEEDTRIKVLRTVKRCEKCIR